MSLLGVLPASSALAEDELAIKHASFIEEGSTLSLTVGFREMLDLAARSRLRNGFATTVVMRIYLYRRDGGRPIAFSARTLKAVYDLWDEQFLLRVEEPGRLRHLKFRDQSQVVDRLTSLWRFPLTSVSAVSPGEEYFVAIIAEVNPMSEATLAEVRQWLRNPYGTQHSVGESFFGSFVSIFINNKIRSAEKTFRLRTQPFYRRP